MAQCLMCKAQCPTCKALIVFDLVHSIMYIPGHCVLKCARVWVDFNNLLCCAPPYSAQDHLKECNFVISLCPNGCEFRANRKGLMEHLLQCPNKTTACPFCKVSFSRNKLQVRKCVCVCVCAHSHSVNECG